ncbi:hypothetical protein HaLaN_06065, partial [Haematococcus lacustris]
MSKPRWSNARFRLYGGKQRTVAKFWAEVAAPGAQHGDAISDQGPDVLNKHRHQVLRPGRVSRAEHPPHCSRAGPPSRAQQLAGPPNYA